MRVLLDTHAYLYFVNDDPRLTSLAREILENADTDAFLSVASLWEITIKHGLGNLQIGMPLEELLQDKLALDDVALINIEASHLLALHRLPMGSHRDPFDRMLVATSLAEKLPILSADTAFDAYGVIRIW